MVFFAHSRATILRQHGFPLSKSYKNSFYCASAFQVKNGMLIQKYCKNRWCQTCIRIRTGAMINKYAPRLDREEHLYFLTLTRPNIPADMLKAELDLYNDLWRTMTSSRYFKKFTKDGGIGIRKVECTYNPERNDYHPHLHVLLSDYETAELMRQQWLRLNPESDPKAQDLSRVKNKGGYIEIFKYFTKLLAKDNSGKRFFDPIHMDVIFEAMSGRRVYTRLGTKKVWGCSEVTEEDEATIATLDYPEGREGEMFKWLEMEDFYGYYSVETGDTLVELPKTSKLHNVLYECEQQMGIHKQQGKDGLEWSE